MCHSQNEFLIVTHQKHPRFHLVKITDFRLLESIGEWLSVKHRLLQCQSNCRPGYSILALVIVFFVLPYFTDVAYYADQTPTHDAQENSKVEGKTEAGGYEKIPLAVADVQNDSVVGLGLTSQNVNNRIPYLIRGTPSSQHLFLALVISRPPPVA